MDVFFTEKDRVEYLRLLIEQSEKFGVQYLSYCLMTNHIHLLAVPERQDSLAKAVGEAHRRYTRMINFRENVRGFLFQGRFYSCPVYTDQFLLAVVRYIEQNSVKADLVKQAWDYQWSSAKFHCGEVAQGPLVNKSSLLEGVSNWREFLSTGPDETSELDERIRTDRPFGPEGFYTVVEEITGIDTRPGIPGRPRKKQQRVPRKVHKCPPEK